MKIWTLDSLLRFSIELSYDLIPFLMFLQVFHLCLITESLLCQQINEDRGKLYTWWVEASCRLFGMIVAWQKTELKQPIKYFRNKEQLLYLYTFNWYSTQPTIHLILLVMYLAVISFDKIAFDMNGPTTSQMRSNNLEIT